MTEHQSHSFRYYPISICWSSIPLITWVVPFIGHAAISDDDGYIYDFQSSYSIGKRKHTTCFGTVLKYVVLDLNVPVTDYNNAILTTNEKYEHLTHNLVIQNCHSHVADVLNTIAYRNKTNWNNLSLLHLLITESKYVNTASILRTYGPFVILTSLMLIAFILLIILI
ncbi:PPPDE domain-containing protein [Entamoeba marina]